jgi:hypothetical protein
VIAALYVEADGAYAHLPGLEVWTEAPSSLSLFGGDAHTDARRYAGPHPVVAHPPCSTWCQLANVNAARYGHRVGDDDGCFEAALAAVRQWGGVLEHPAYSMAWAAFNLQRPARGSWQPTSCGAFVTEVSQSAYGHRARKRTWLYYVGAEPSALDWRDVRGDAWVGWCRHKRDTQPVGGSLTKDEAKASPPAFRDLLLSLARGARR